MKIAAALLNQLKKSSKQSKDSLGRVVNVTNEYKNVVASTVVGKNNSSTDNQNSICSKLETADFESSQEKLSLKLETIEKIGEFKKSISAKETTRFSKLHVNKTFILTLEEWEKMTRNRLQHRFNGSLYIDILLSKLRTLCSGCVRCIENNYLRHPSSVLKLRKNSSRYVEGYVSFYCKHFYCCDCDVTRKVKFYTNHDKVEAATEVSGKRSRFRWCTKFRPVKGKIRMELAEKLKHEKPYLVFRKMQLSLNEEERVYGSSTYAPSHAV